MMTPVTEHLSFWGEVFPVYLGAVGGIASAFVAIAAFVQSIRNKRSVASVREALEPEEPTLTEQPARTSSQPTSPEGTYTSPTDESSDIGETVARGYIAGPNPPREAPWTLMRDRMFGDSGADLVLANSSDHELTLVSLDVFNGTQWASVNLARADRVGPGDVRYFDFKVVGGRGTNINLVRLVWLENDGSIRSQQILI